MMMPMRTTVRNPYDEVQVMAETVPLGCTTRFMCPKCAGGVSREKGTFAVSRTDGGRVYFCCFRAKCCWRGTITSGLVSQVAAAPISKIRLFTRPTEELTSEQLVWYRTKFGLSPDHGVRFCPSSGMFAYKVYGPDNQVRGWQLRDYNPGVTVKALNYLHRDEPFISWYFPRKPIIGGVVVVEDIPSARKVASCGVAACALLGTAIDFERAYEIASLAENFVILALDRGMLAKQIEYRQKYEALWGSVEIWQLQEDLKYVNRKRIMEALYDGKSDFISVHSEPNQL